MLSRFGVIEHFQVAVASFVALRLLETQSLASRQMMLQGLIRVKHCLRSCLNTKSGNLKNSDYRTQL